MVILDGEHFLIGAHPRNDLVLTDPMVSRFHCRLTRTRDAWRVADTGSRNGTIVAGIRVRDADLALPECRIVIGESVVRVRELPPAGAAHLPDSPWYGSLCGNSVPMRRLFDLIDKAARSDSDVLVEGESGTGKELVARELVRHSKRADKPFIIVDCGSISPALLESELFGHARGAFTGADRPRVGAFEEADKGTLLLDEIGELPLEMQPKLLRVLAEREVRRIGENQRRKVDVRVIAATNRWLEREVNQGRFRGDLYFRLSVVTLRTPPLRDRAEDIPLLVHNFLASLDMTDKEHLFTPELIEQMASYDWPGNVRELRNYVERRVILGGSSHPWDGQEPQRPSQPGSNEMVVDLETPFKNAKDRVIEVFEKGYLSALLAWAEGNVSRAARKARMDRMYLHRLLHRYGLRRGGTLSD
jgi:DNA-binding NtrC family response regulator